LLPYIKVFPTEELKAFASYESERVREQVRTRLEEQINFWYSEHMRLSEQEREGRATKRTAAYALEHAQNLEKRLVRRMLQLDQMALLVATPTVIRGATMVIPEQLLQEHLSDFPPTDEEPAVFAKDTQGVERRAVDLALASEKQLGRVAVEQARNNPGYDIRSVDEQGRVYFLEVKGRIKGAEDFIITANEVIFAQTQNDRHRLVLVEVDPETPDNDVICYVSSAFSTIEVSPTTQKLVEKWDDYWSRGMRPH
jgi:hypothetical protein